MNFKHPLEYKEIEFIFHPGEFGYQPKNLDPETNNLSLYKE